MTTEEAKQLLIKYNAGQCTEAEKALVENWFLTYNEHDIDLPQERIEKIGQQIYSELPVQHITKKVNLWHGIAAIAAITLLTLGFWHLIDRLALPPEQVIVQDVSPGSNKATITLENGETIHLSNLKNGVAINRDGLSYLDGSSITDLKQKNNSFPLQTLSTPKGGEYRLVLSDGTKVWLNAASSLTYPSSFTNEKERIVNLIGEAYFEVAHNKNQPFVVKTATQKVEVLGTHFNINSYNDDGNTITTLVEGAVRVTNKSEKHALLTPNQQTIVNANNLYVQTADIEPALAWKNGKIEFKGADLKTIMKQVSRWYNIEVEYNGELSERVFNGSISRRSNLSVLLKILEYSNVHFKLEQGPKATKKLIVTP